MFSIEPGRDYAVVTGDVIDSSSLTAAERRELPGLLHHVSDELLTWKGADRVTPVSVFGGDSWRLLLRDPGDALRVGVFVRASVLASPMGMDTRFAIGVGGVDFVPPGGIEEADGEAFRLSGRLLAENSKRPREIRFATAAGSKGAEWLLPLWLLDALIRSSWTEKRALAVCGALQDKTRQQIAGSWAPPVSRQTVDRHLHEACWDEVSQALDDFEGELSLK